MVLANPIAGKRRGFDINGSADPGKAGDDYSKRGVAGSHPWAWDVLRLAARRLGKVAAKAQNGRRSCYPQIKPNRLQVPP